jgi:hypothetical protein
MFNPLKIWNLIVALELNEFNLNLVQIYLFNKIHMSSHVGFIVVGVLLQEKEIVPEELGVNQHQTPWRLTFPLSKESLGAYRSYKCNIESCLSISMHALYCTLSIGFLDDVRNYMLYPSILILVSRCMYFYWLNVPCLVLLDIGRSRVVGPTHRSDIPPLSKGGQS